MLATLGYFAARMLFGCPEPTEAFPDWRRDFGREAPLSLEIGPGRGAFALDHAARHPELDLVAIETRRSDCELIRSRAARRGLQNLIVLQGDARLLIPRLFRPGSLGALHVQFPDPWWKKRHHKRRMVDVDFAVQMRRVAPPGGAGGGSGPAGWWTSAPTCRPMRARGPRPGSTPASSRCPTRFPKSSPPASAVMPSPVSPSFARASAIPAATWPFPPPTAPAGIGATCAGNR